MAVMLVGVMAEHWVDEKAHESVLTKVAVWVVYNKRKIKMIKGGK